MTSNEPVNSDDSLDRVTTYHYDGDGRTVGPVAKATTWYFYDADGQIISRSESPGANEARDDCMSDDPHIVG